MALCDTHAGVEDADANLLMFKTGAEAFYQLRRERDLRHQDQRLLPQMLHHVGNGVKIHLGFTTAGYAMEQEWGELSVLSRMGTNRLHGGFLFRRKLRGCIRCNLQSGERITAGAAHLALYHPLLLQALQGRMRLRKAGADILYVRFAAHADEVQQLLLLRTAHLIFGSAEAIGYLLLLHRGFLLGEPGGKSCFQGQSKGVNIIRAEPLHKRNTGRIQGGNLRVEAGAHRLKLPLLLLRRMERNNYADGCTPAQGYLYPHSGTQQPLKLRRYRIA